VLVPFALVALWRRDRPATSLLIALFVAVFGLAATWWSWQGGWSWGPRLVIPGVALVLVALGPWIGASRTRLRLAGALFALGFVISFSAVLAPPGRQLLDDARGTDGPQIVRQYGVVPELTERSIHAAGDRSARDGDYRRYLAPWQAGLVRRVGGWTVWPAALVTLLLLAALLSVGAGLTRRPRGA